MTVADITTGNVHLLDLLSSLQHIYSHSVYEQYYNLLLNIEQIYKGLINSFHWLQVQYIYKF